MNTAVILPNPFPVVRYHVHAVAEQPIDLPEFSGSILRGVFGHALRKALCVTGKEKCGSCPLHRSCDYPAIFETPPPPDTERIYSDIPHPYVIEPPSGERILQQGDALDFSFVLIGPALSRFALIAGTWQQALRRPIASQQGGTARLKTICLEDGRIVFDAGQQATMPHPQQIIIPPVPDALETVTLAFRTPLNLRHQGHYLGPDDISVKDLLRALIRRIGDLCALQLGRPLRLDVPRLLDTADDLEVRTDLRAQGWQRYSNRQHRHMPVAGVTGFWQLTGNLNHLWPFLYLGQWVHAGKKTTFGLGHYQLITHGQNNS